MGTRIALMYFLQSHFIGIGGIDLQPSPVANVVINSPQSFNCSVDTNWKAVTFAYDNFNKAIYVDLGGTCVDMANPGPWFTTECDYITRKFYMTKHNMVVPDQGKVVTCDVTYNNGNSETADTTINVQYAPDTTPVITQSPTGAIISDEKVTLICSVSGGNPLAVLSWNCSGTYNDNTSGNTSSYSVDFTVDKTYNNRICTCSGSHSVTSYRPTVHHRLVVYYAPATNLHIQQSPSGVIVNGDVVKLACSVSGGNPLPILSWNCTGIKTNNTSEDTASYGVEFTVDKSHNGKTCTCSATHPVTSYRPVVHTCLEVFYTPDTTPVITQSPSGSIISGEKVTLTCTVSGGYPLAVLSWNCSGNNKNHTSGITASYSVDFTVDKTYNNRICTCSGSHIVTSYRPTVHHRLVVYYTPTTNPHIQQSPSGVIVDGDLVKLTCSVSGGNPLPVLSWNCTGSNTNNSLGDTASYGVEFTVDKSNNGNTCTCSATHPVTSYRPVVYIILEVFYTPDTIPVITQTPLGQIISGTKVTLTCTVSGGNPLTVLSWNCSGNNKNNTSGNTASYSVDFTVDKTYNNRICTCSASHGVPTYGPTVQHGLVVYYAPATAPTIQQTPDGPIVPGDKVMLTCTAPGGNPLAVLYWDCNGTVTNHTSENTASYSVEFTTDTTYNNKICNCSATHPVTSYRPSVQHKLEVYCSPQYMQNKDGRGLFTAGISSLVISVLALILTIVLIACWRFRMTKTSKSPDHYTEFNTKSSTETVAYDVINQTTNIDTNRSATEDIERGVYSYEECQPYRNTDHSSDDVRQEPKGSKMMTGEEYDYVKI